MFSCSYNKDESAIEVVERLTPQFEMVLKKLGSISDAVESMSNGAHNMPAVSGAETSACEPSIETEEIRANLAEMNHKLAVCERDRDEAQAQLEELNQQLEASPDKPDSNKADIEELIKIAEEALQQSEAEAQKNAAMAERLQGELTVEKETSSQKIAELSQQLTDSDDAKCASQENLDKCKSELEELQKEFQEAQGESSGKIAELSQKLTTADDAKRVSQENLDDCKSELEKLQKEFAEAQSESSGKIAELTQQVSTIEGEKRSVATEVQEISSKLTSLRLDYDSLSTERDELTQKTIQMQRQIEIDGKLEALMWPDFLAKPEMQDWKQRMEDAVHQDSTEENAVVLVANLFNYNAIVGLGSEWHRRLFDVLHDFSRALFAWCESLNYDREQAVIEAEMWATEFSGKNSGEFSIEVPEPDEPFDKRVMVSYETGGASTSRDVKAVKTWCIKDGAGRILKQAEVTTC